VHNLKGIDLVLCSGASSLEKGDCCGRTAFDINFQRKTTLSLKTRKRPMNFAMLPKYCIGKFGPTYSISAIFAHESHYASFLHGVFGNPTCYFVYDLMQILCTVPYDALPSDCIE